jgi:hypothetical protein
MEVSARDLANTMRQEIRGMIREEIRGMLGARSKPHRWLGRCGRAWRLGKKVGSYE